MVAEGIQRTKQETKITKMPYNPHNRRRRFISVEDRDTRANDLLRNRNLLRLDSQALYNNDVDDFRADAGRAVCKVRNNPEYFGQCGGRKYEYVKAFILCNFCNRKLGLALLSCCEPPKEGPCCGYPRICCRCSYVRHQKPLQDVLWDGFKAALTYVHVTASIKEPLALETGTAADESLSLLKSFQDAVIKLTHVPSRDSKRKLSERRFMGYVVFHEFAVTSLYPAATVRPHSHLIVVLMPGVSVESAMKALKVEYRRFLRSKQFEERPRLSVHHSVLDEGHYQSMLHYRKPADFVTAYESAALQPDVDFYVTNHHLLEMFELVHGCSAADGMDQLKRGGCLSGRSKARLCRRVKDVTRATRRKRGERLKDLAVRGAKARLEKEQADTTCLRDEVADEGDQNFQGTGL